MEDDPPSRYLRSLYPPPSPASLFSSLARLSDLFFPSNVVVDLRIPILPLLDEAVGAEEPLVAEAKAEEDHFERDYARGWAERVVAVASRALARGVEEFEAWEEVVDAASALLANLSGHSAQGSSTSTYLLPSPPPFGTFLPRTTPSDDFPSPSSPHDATPIRPISLTICDTTLLQNSTGHRTWGSAALLAQSLASYPSSFFPSTFPCPRTRRSPLSLRVLELGSGTGLVGLTAASVLSRLTVAAPDGRASKPVVALTDGGAEPAAVLDNLSANVELNAVALDGVEVEVEVLDWRDFLPSGEGGRRRMVEEEEKYDVILAADVCYEPGMAEALHAAIAGLLRFPPARRPPSPKFDSTDPPSPSPPRLTPAFHLTFPLRRTHTAETAAVSRLFPPASSPPSSSSSASSSTTLPLHDSSFVFFDSYTSRRFRLVAQTVEEVVGPDGFGGAGGGGRGGRKAAPEGEMEYRVMRIGWEEVEV